MTTPPHFGTARARSGGDQPGDHERRIRALEQAKADRDLEMSVLRQAVTDVNGRITGLHDQLFGDPKRQDLAGRGAFVGLETAMAQMERRLTDRLAQQTADLQEDLKDKVSAIEDKLQGRNAKRKMLSDRTWNVVTILLSTVLIFAVYVILHFLPSVKP